MEGMARVEESFKMLFNASERKRAGLKPWHLDPEADSEVDTMTKPGSSGGPDSLPPPTPDSVPSSVLSPLSSAVPAPLREAYRALCSLEGACETYMERASMRQRMLVLGRLLERLAGEQGRKGTPGRRPQIEAAGSHPPTSADNCFELALGSLASSGTLAFEYFGESTRGNPAFAAAVTLAVRAAEAASIPHADGQVMGLMDARGVAARSARGSGGRSMYVPAAAPLSLEANGGWVSGLRVIAGCLGQHITLAINRSLQTFVVVLLDRRGIFDTLPTARHPPRFKAMQVPMFSSGDVMGHRTRKLPDCLGRIVEPHGPYIVGGAMGPCSPALARQVVRHCQLSVREASQRKCCVAGCCSEDADREAMSKRCHEMHGTVAAGITSLEENTAGSCRRGIALNQEGVALMRSTEALEAGLGCPTQEMQGPCDIAAVGCLARVQRGARFLHNELDGADLM